MFGLDSIFGGSGIFGKLFDSIGLGWMGNVLSLAADAMTGNWIGAAKDVFDLVSKFSNSWSKQVSPFQPLGEFSSNGCFGGGDLTSDRLSDIMGDASDTGRTGQGLSIVQDTVASRSQIDFSRRSVIGAASV
jgi:hypothetical protein